MLNLAKYLELEGQETGDVCSVLMLLARHILNATDAQVADILLKRAIREHDCDDVEQCVVELDDVVSAFDQQEQESAKKSVEAQRSRAASARILSEEVVSHRKKLLGGKSSSSSSTNPSHKKKSPLAGHEVPPEIPPGAITQKFAKAMLPPGAFIWQGAAGGTRASHLPPHKRFSQSWMAAGSHQEACLNAIRDTWRKFLSDHNMKLSQCPIRDLFSSG